jgi:hypothetical protein
VELTLFDRQFDIFTSASDIKSIYHEDQIAQSLGQYDDNLSTNHFHVGYLLVGFAHEVDQSGPSMDSDRPRRALSISHFTRLIRVSHYLANR